MILECSADLWNCAYLKTHTIKRLIKLTIFGEFLRKIDSFTRKKQAILGTLKYFLWSC